jgi:hypothetical protein
MPRFFTYPKGVSARLLRLTVARPLRGRSTFLRRPEPAGNGSIAVFEIAGLSFHVRRQTLGRE